MTTLFPAEKPLNHLTITHHSGDKFKYTTSGNIQFPEGNYTVAKSEILDYFNPKEETPFNADLHSLMKRLASNSAKTSEAE